MGSDIVLLFWGMTREDTFWHVWPAGGDVALCGMVRTSPLTLGSVEAGDCATCRRLAGQETVR